MRQSQQDQGHADVGCSNKGDRRSTMRCSPALICFSKAAVYQFVVRPTHIVQSGAAREERNRPRIFGIGHEFTRSFESDGSEVSAPEAALNGIKG